MHPRLSLGIAITLALAVLLFAPETRAQSRAPQPPPPEERIPVAANAQPDLFEASVGFTYLRADDALVKNMYGGDVSLFANLNSWIAVGAEFIGAYGQENRKFFFRSTSVEESRFVYVGGVRINVWRTGNLKVFAEVLGGGAHGHASALIFGIDRSASADGFAAVLGAGAEWKFTRRLAWRIVETDYIPAHFNGQWENDWRVSTGLSFSFGTGW